MARCLVGTGGTGVLTADAMAVRPTVVARVQSLRRPPPVRRLPRESVRRSDGNGGLRGFFRGFFFSVSSSSLISIAEGDGGDGFVDIN